MYSNEHLNREVRWDLHHEVPSGWAAAKAEPGPVREAGHKLYDVLRRTSDTGRQKNDAWGKRDEWTQARDPDLEHELPRGGAKLPEERSGASSEGPG